MILLLVFHPPSVPLSTTSYPGSLIDRLNDPSFSLSTTFRRQMNVNEHLGFLEPLSPFLAPRAIWPLPRQTTTIATKRHFTTTEWRTVWQGRGAEKYEEERDRYRQVAVNNRGLETRQVCFLSCSTNKSIMVNYRYYEWRWQLTTATKNNTRPQPNDERCDKEEEQWKY